MAIIDSAVSLQGFQQEFTITILNLCPVMGEDVAFLEECVKNKEFQENPVDFLGLPFPYVSIHKPRVPLHKVCLTDDFANINKRTVFLIDDPFSRHGWGFAYWRYLAPVHTDRRVLILDRGTLESDYKRSLVV